MTLTGVGGQGGYTGPGDLVSGATAWYGLRAYKASVAATGTQKAVNVRRASDNATQDILILTNGNFDTASAASFAGTDATATCSTTGSSTTAACTGASATPNVGDPVSCTGCTQPLYLTAVGAFVAGAGSVTLSAAQNIAVAVTFTFQVALFVPKWYDQSGNTRDAAQATTAKQPQLLLTCLGTLPCVLHSGSQYATATIPATNQQYTFSIVSRRTGSFTTSLSPFATFNGGNEGSISYNNSANSSLIFAGTSLSASTSDAALHSITGVFNGASSVISIDGADTTGNAGAAATSTSLSIGANGNGSSPYVGYFAEGGMWPAGFSSTQRAATCHNQTYWGVSGC